jgi:hypothetical protein
MTRWPWWLPTVIVAVSVEGTANVGDVAYDGDTGARTLWETTA